MARSHAACRRNRLMSVLGPACVTVTVLSGLAMPLAAGALGARAAGALTGTARTPLSLTVTSVSPSYATPGHKITIRGRLRNGTHSAMSGLSVRILSSTSPLSSGTDLKEFAAGKLQVAEAPLALAPVRIRHLRSRHSVAWSVRIPAADLRLACFGVYPLTVTASNAAGTVTSADPVPLPFWPNKANSCPTASRPAPFPISWIWPLIDSPHAGPCTGLVDNSLAASLAPGGRLAQLLDVGSAYATKDHLTWAIDPALLDNAQTMTTSYQVGGSPDCRGSTTYRADPAAGQWLTAVVHDTAGQPVFVTPYADVDVAGLARYGNNPDLRSAFTDGQRLAGPLLHRGVTPAQVPASARALSAVAWPASGFANAEVLQNLGAMHIGTVILAMPSSTLTYTPGAVTSVPDGVGTRLKVLLADNALRGLLGSSAVSSARPGTIFGVSQLFLAETAMIVAEAPAMVRPILIAPPRRWDPSAGTAAALLGETSGAPWLRPSTIGQLAAQPQEHDFSALLRPPPAGGELGHGLLRKVSALDHRVALLQSIMTAKDPQLNHAVFAIESSSWVGGRASRAKVMLRRTGQYVTDQLAGLSVGGKQVVHVTLGGRVGSVTVSIHNSLGYPVRVGLRVMSSNDTVIANQKRPHEVYEVPARSSTELKLSVNAAQTGKAKVRLNLRTPHGTLLPDPPDKPLVMEISATNLGTVALVICAAALGIFVIASAAQAIRRGRPGSSGNAAGQDQRKLPAGPDDTEPDPSGEAELSTAGPAAGRPPDEESR